MSTPEQIADTLEVQSFFGKGFSKIERVAGAYLAAKGLYATGKGVYNWVNGKRTYTVTVMGTDYIYPVLHDWILERLPDEKRRSLLAESTKRKNTKVIGGYESDWGEQRAEIALRYDGNRTHTVDIGGNTIELTVTQQENIPSELKLFGQQREKITLRAKKKQGRDAIVNLLQRLLKESLTTNKVPLMHMVTRWGEWRARSDLPIRNIESVILKPGHLDAICSDLQDFLDSEEFYNERCIPWHRGYLFYGPPGTGKTSTAKALASHLGLDIYYLSLGDAGKDDDILSLISQVPERSVLLLEDIDTFHVATSREDNEGPSMSSLLNALDGLSTPHGLITIMTTNDKSALDDALIRPGRVDHQEFFDLADSHQASQIFKWFYGVSPTRDLIRRSTAPSDIISIMYSYKTDPMKAEEKIRALD